MANKDFDELLKEMDNSQLCSKEYFLRNIMSVKISFECHNGGQNILPFLFGSLHNTAFWYFKNNGFEEGSWYAYIPAVIHREYNICINGYIVPSEFIREYVSLH